MAEFTVLPYSEAPLSQRQIPERTYYLAGAIARAISFGIEPTVEWVQKREWVLDHRTASGHGWRLTIPVGDVTDEEAETAIQRANFWIENA